MKIEVIPLPLCNTDVYKSSRQRHKTLRDTGRHRGKKLFSRWHC